jgi:hypothetical protein
MDNMIHFIAGSNAARIIRDEGLDPDRISVLVGAAGGPKALVLGGIDRALAGRLFKKRKKPLFVVGASIGTWRFAAFAQKNQMKALDEFEKSYMSQFYKTKPTAHQVMLESQRILDDYLEDSRAPELLLHPYVRLNILSVRSKTLFASESFPALASGMALATIGNFFSRSTLRFFFERALFYDPRDIPPFFDMKGFPVHRVPLSPDNIKPAIMASGSIPLVMEGMRGIPGAPEGLYRDGGMTDYHPSMLFDPNPDHIVLYPHYSEQIIPGWLDKHLPWRRAGKDVMSNVLIACPSRSFVSRLPYGKIPDRNDFKRFLGKDGERLAYWNTAVAEGRKMGEEFMEAIETKKIKNMIADYAGPV